MKAPKSYGPCPHCGKRTEGQHIAGTVYDYQCNQCCDEIDGNFQAFVDALVAEHRDTEETTP